MTTQDQYTDTIRRSQEAWSGAIESLTSNAQMAFGQSAKSLGTTDPTAAIDQVFDFWKQTLDVQREVAKQLVSATVTTGETVRSQAESVGTAIREQAESAGTAFREQAESVGQAGRQQAESAARDHAAKKYESFTKEQLHAELGRRNLAKSGTVDELRERLLADDQK